VRGAFTGAVRSRRGRFALAGRGTIFLDEIGDTAPEFQAKLLRVLQEREFYPVGAERPERTEARVIAATHRDLERLVQQGQFRGDLYYRLHVMEIVVPPLRERAHDIPALAHHFVRCAGESMQRPNVVLSDESLAVLMHRRWPGNVRELEHCLMRAVVLASGDVIRPEHLAAAPSDDVVSSDVVSSPRLPTLDQWEREHVERVMAAAGQKLRAAQILGISRPRLDRLLAKHGLE
jgi:transcriptional regulator with GAF, ATPase, and Fis domain